MSQNIRQLCNVLLNTVKRSGEQLTQINVGIDVFKDKRDCHIVSSEGKILGDVFTIENNMDGFNMLFQSIKSVAPDLSKVKVGLETSGHYSYNILGFILDKGLHTYVINPLHTNLFRKSTSLRRTKTDRVDARTIAAMIMPGVVLKSYTAISYHNEELNSLTGYRFDKVQHKSDNPLFQSGDCHTDIQMG